MEFAEIEEKYGRFCECAARKHVYNNGAETVFLEYQDDFKIEMLIAIYFSGESDDLKIKRCAMRALYSFLRLVTGCNREVSISDITYFKSTNSEDFGIDEYLYKNSVEDIEEQSNVFNVAGRYLKTKPENKNGEWRKGGTKTRPRLSDEVLTNIWRLASEGKNCREISKIVGHGDRSVYAIINSETYSDIPESAVRYKYVYLQKLKNREVGKRKRWLPTPAQIENITRLYAEGKNLREIGSVYNVDRHCIKSTLTKSGVV